VGRILGPDKTGELESSVMMLCQIFNRCAFVKNSNKDDSITPSKARAETKTNEQTSEMKSCSTKHNISG
jgi:hypothetical protein